MKKANPVQPKIYWIKCCCVQSFETHLIVFDPVYVKWPHTWSVLWTVFYGAFVLLPVYLVWNLLSHAALNEWMTQRVCSGNPKMRDRGKKRTRFSVNIFIATKNDINFFFLRSLTFNLHAVVIFIDKNNVHNMNGHIGMSVKFISIHYLPINGSETTTALAWF